MARKRNRPLVVERPVRDSKPTDRAEWRRTWIEAARNLSPAAQEIAATAPLEEIGPLMLDLARQGRLSPPPASEGEDIVDQLFARARQLDPVAWAERDRLEAERGVNPDLLGQRPRNLAERRMRDRRSHSMALAHDEAICAGDARIAAVLAQLEDATRH